VTFKAILLVFNQCFPLKTCVGVWAAFSRTFTWTHTHTHTHTHTRAYETGV